MNEFTKFLQFAKVEESGDGNVVVWGIATEQTPDLDEEICDYDAAKPVYMAWSEAAAERTKNAGVEQSLGPVRLQHSIEIGGKATKLEFNDGKKQIWLGSEPFNAQILADLKKGFYTGYSQGGAYAWRKCANCDNSMPLQQGANYCKTCKANVQVVYGLKSLTEVSYVDSPCSGIGFDYVKANGSRELVKFAKRSATMELTEEQIQQIVRKAKEKTKRVAGVDLPASSFAYVGDPEKTATWKLPIEFPGDEEKTKRHIRNALARFSQAKGIPADKKEEVKAKIVAAAKKHGIDVDEESAKAARFHEATVSLLKTRIDAAAESQGLRKGLYDVSRCAELLQSIACLYEQACWEREVERDDSEVPDELGEILDDLVETFIAMAEEEATELAVGNTGKSLKGAPMKQEEIDALTKAAKKTLAHHFAKAASHHEKLAAEHEKKAAHHLDLHELHKAHADKAKAAKADVGNDEPHAVVGEVLANQQEYHKAAAEHHLGLHKAATRLHKAHAAHAEHLHKMAEEHDSEEHEKTVKAIKAEAATSDPDPAPVQKAAPSMEDDVAAEAARMRETPEYKKSISDIAAAKVAAEVQDLRNKTLAFDGVRIGGAFKSAEGKPLTIVPRDAEADIPVESAGVAGANYGGL